MQLAAHPATARAATRATRTARHHPVVCAALPTTRPAASSPVGLGLASIAAAGVLLATTATPALADLNKYEYSAPSEFGQGSSQQWGEADIDGRDFSNQDLRRSNFTSASCKRTNFSNSNMQGAYFMKAVVYKANFEGANLSDVLMDRAVLNEANLRNANLERTVLTRSDLTDADIYGADFSNALIDKAQQIKLCRYADGVNSVTGVSTRASLGCGSMRKFRAAAPSSPDGPQVAEEEKEVFRSLQPKYYE